MSDPIWVVEPVGPLTGDVVVSGAKNAVTKHMVAALLADSPSQVTNAPRIGDVDITRGMMEALGATVEVDGATISIDPTTADANEVPRAFARLNRIPILMVGPLLHRHGEARVPKVGGDRIGQRPVDFHIDALEAMGADVIVGDDEMEAKATRLHGARIRFPFPSVGATETALLTAVLAEGRTVLENAAVEPEVVELALFLQRMGARIELRPERRFVVEGVERLHGAQHRLEGDRIEAFSYLVAGLATRGRVRVVGIAQARLVTAITTLHRIGARFEITDEWIAADADGLRATTVQTETHPGFMSDWQQPLTVLLTQAQGLSVIHETVHQDRFDHVGALRAMGAEIDLYDQCLGGYCWFHETNDLHSAVVHGPTPLHGADIAMPDLRAGFAYVLAAAVAETPSRLTGVHQLERGYERPREKFAEIGLVIESM